MKAMNKLIFISLGVFLFISGCTPKNTSDNAPQPEVIQEVEKKDSTKYLYIADWCTLPRGEFISGTGIIDSLSVASFHFGYELLPQIEGFYTGFNLDKIGKDGRLYFCADIPQAYKKHKLKVKFSGYAKDMRLVDLRSILLRALPIEITEIRSADGK